MFDTRTSVFFISCPGIGLIIIIGNCFASASATVEPPAFEIIISLTDIISCILFTNSNIQIFFLFIAYGEGSDISKLDLANAVKSLKSFGLFPQTTRICSSSEIIVKDWTIFFTGPIPNPPAVTSIVNTESLIPNFSHNFCLSKSLENSG